VPASQLAAQQQEMLQPQLELLLLLLAAVLSWQAL
jgi:hypothetical protein